MIKRIEASELLDTDQKAAFVLERDRYRTRRDALSDDMVSEYLQWWKQWIIQKGYARVSEYPDYQVRMQSLQTQRRDNALHTLTTVSSILSDEQHHAIGQRLDEKRKRIEQAAQEFGPAWPPHDK